MSGLVRCRMWTNVGQILHGRCWKHRIWDGDLIISVHFIFACFKFMPDFLVVLSVLRWDLFEGEPGEHYFNLLFNIDTIRNSLGYGKSSLNSISLSRKNMIFLGLMAFTGR